ncbi:MAG: amino acid adenylation domain-containing protein, partial [Cyanobacteria bacterium J06560_2]
MSSKKRLRSFSLITAVQLGQHLRPSFQVFWFAFMAFDDRGMTTLTSDVSHDVSRQARRRMGKRAPLSFGQRQLYFLGQITSDGAEYNIPNAYVFKGSLHFEALEYSFGVLVARHDSLRTHFDAGEPTKTDGKAENSRTDGGTSDRTNNKRRHREPVQVVEAAIAPTIRRLDFSHLPPDERHKAASAAAARDSDTPFVLMSQAPLWRMTLIQLSPTEHWLLFTVHHIIFDGWSVNLFFNELLALYEAKVNHQPCALPPLPMQYADFAWQQQQRLQGDLLAGLLKYWTQKLGTQLQTLELPTDLPRPPQPSYRGGSVSIELSAQVVGRLRVLGRHKKATLFMTLLAAFKVLLFRYTKQTDIVVGTPIANRARPELEAIIGFLVNTLVLRTSLTGNQGFAQVLDQVRVSALEAYDYQELPFDLLVEALQPARDLSYNPLFQVMFQLHEKPAGAAEKTELAYRPLDLESYHTNFDLVMEIDVQKDGLMATLEYSQDLFHADTIKRMLGHFQVLLAGIVANIDQPIAQLPLLTTAERSQLLKDWNSPHSKMQGIEHPRPKTVAIDQIDLTLALSQQAEGMVGEVTYYSDFSQAEAIASILDTLSAQLRKVAQDGTYQPPQQLTLTSDSRSQLNVNWQEQQTASPSTTSIQCLHQQFAAQVEQTPDRIAVSYCSSSGGTDSGTDSGTAQTLSSQQLTYAELNAKVNQLAHYLTDWDIQPDQPVGLFLERSPEMIIALLAVLKAGGAYLPLAPDYPQERISYIVSDANVNIVLTHSDIQSRLAGAGHRAVDHIVCLDQNQAAIATRSAKNPTTTVTPHHLAYIIYTSGSTGKPKGVMIEHRAAVHFTQAAIAEYQITAADCVLQFASISFDLAVEEIFTALLSGAKLQLRNEAMLGTAAQFVQSCQSWGLSVLNLPTAYWHQLVADMAATHFRLPKAVRLVLIGGERALPSRIKTWQQLVGDYPHLINAYGPTETTVTATAFHIDSRTQIHQEVPIGRPLANTETYILDGYGQLQPVGVPGELHIGGQSLARGYLNRPDLTQLKFVPHPFSDDAAAKLYKTGDQARYLPDGSIEFLGRIDSQVKIRGFRIELGEIEAALLQYPGVRETIVVAREDTPGNPRLAAYMIEHSDQSVSPASLRDFLHQSLPSYMVPTMLDFLPSFPLTPNGKIDVRSLPLPVGRAALEDTAYIAPRTPLEETLATIWATALEVEKVSVRDSFFELGGHSLQAIQVMAQIIETLDVELPLSALFQSPTVEEMGHTLTQAGAKVPWSPLVSLQPEDSSCSSCKRPFFAVHGGHGEVLFYQLLTQHLGKSQPFYALRALGNDYPDMAHCKIEEMATCYIEAIRKVQPEGPYRIGGTSLGGIVAFEMARQLQAMGQTTERLILFDTGGFDNFAIPLPLHRRILNLFRYVPKYGLAETWRRLELRILKMFVLDSAVEFYRATGKMPTRFSTELDVWETVWLANLEAVDRYRPQPYDGQATLLRAIDDGDFMWSAHAPDYGWGRYVLGGVSRRDLPGTHTGIFKAPAVRELAHHVADLLNTSDLNREKGAV